MPFTRRAAVALIVLSLSLRASAASVEIPYVVTQGFASYRALGVSAAVKTWMKGSPIEGSEAVSDEARVLSLAENRLGRFEGFEVLQVSEFGSRTLLIYAALHYERGPLFGKFLVYRIRNDWVINGIRFDPAPEQILPEPLLD